VRSERRSPAWLDGHSIYRCGDLVGRVVWQVVRCVEIVFDRIRCEVEVDPPSLGCRYGGMGFHPLQTVAVLCAAALLGLGEQPTKRMRDGTVYELHSDGGKRDVRKGVWRSGMR